VLKKNNLYYPSEDFKKKALANDKKIYKEADKDPIKFWEGLAEKLSWQKKWEKAFEHKPPYFKWFLGGKINITSNIFEDNPQGWEKIKNKTALIWEPEPINEKPQILTYEELLKKVCQLSNALKKLGVKKGDRVGIYLPMIPEVVISMLACARIGAVHAVVFSAYSSHALQIRLQDTKSKILITTDGYYRRGRVINLKEAADEGIKETNVEKLIVVKRAKNKVSWNKNQDLDFEEIIKNEDNRCEAEIMDSEDPFFILYTSGCCHGDTLVQLDTGEIKKISDLVEKGGSNLVNTDLKKLKQGFDPIIGRHRYHEFSSLINIKTPLFNIKVTPNHHLFVLEDNGEIIEKRAADLKKGDHVLQTTKVDIKGSEQKLPSAKDIEYHPEKCNKNNISNKPKLPKVLTSNFSQILGYFLGDGGLVKGRISATDKDKNNLLFYKKLFEKEFKIRCFVKNYSRQRLIVNSVFFSRYLSTFFPEIFDNSYERKIPRIIQVSKKECIAAFIRGFFDAEGCVTGRSVKITSQSRELIQMLQMLFLRFGIIGNYFKEKRKTHFGKKYSYKIITYGIKITDRRSLKNFKAEIGFSSQDKERKLNKLLKILQGKKELSMIYQTPINGLMRLFRKTITLPKKECRKIHLDSYIYTDRRIKTDRLPEICKYIEGKIKLITEIDLSQREGIKTIVSLFKIKEKDLAQISGKSPNTVHQYLCRKNSLISSQTLRRFYDSIVPYLEELKEEKLKILQNILDKIERLRKAENYKFFEVKQLKQEKNDSNFVYDLSALNNYNYIANSFVVHNSTGKPKGILHTCGGYAVQAKFTGKWIFDLKVDDILWCTSDIGWITGHTYTVYSPLLNVVPTLLFEGAPDWPQPDRWAEIIEKYKVTTFYTAPTAIRMFEKYGTKVIEKYKFESLQLLGSVGEPIDEAAWFWYFENVGKERCPIVDTWWQTETGGILITSLPGIGPLKPAFTGLSFPGTKFDIFDEKGKSCSEGKKGNLVLLPPFAPGLLRGVYKNPQKYLDTYWGEYGTKIYFTSDAAYKDKDGLIRIIGRVDDVIKMAGHRLSTGELEAAVNLHLDITECAAVGIPDKIKGEVPVIFVIVKKKAKFPSLKKLQEEVIEFIKKEIGPIALPKEIYLVEDLPKTRSGKIMRRILKKLFSGEDLGDLSTLANPESVDKLKKIISSNN